MTSLTSKYRTHTCNDLSRVDVGKHVTVSGWIHKMRDHGGVLFVDLRDNYGLTQVVLHDDLKEQVAKLRLESVICVRGEVLARSDTTINPKLKTGEIEVRATLMELLSEADVVPFQIAEDDNAPENTRLKYRFLELRREKLHNNILLRSKVIYEMRRIMWALGFYEFQTPILTASSPEGARDYIVPSRVHPGRFFALPQAPQMFKQLLMVSGFDRYFQIAPCFRDEDARADRSPGEFYQLDLEMSFVEQEDVFAVAEELMYQLFSKFSSWEITRPPFPRVRYEDSMNWYGSDKPDLRIPLKIEDVSSIFSKTEFKVFRGALSELGSIRALKLDLPQLPPRKWFDDTVEAFSQANGMGLAYINFEGEAMKGSVAKFISDDERKALIQTLGTGATSVVFFAAGPTKKILPALGKLRVKVAQDFKIGEREAYRFCYITDFPMYEEEEDTGKIVFSHNPFSMPQGGMEALNTKHPLDIKAFQYDIVCNGYELSSGAIRNHQPDIMYKAFEIAGYTQNDVDEKFGGMIKAFKFGAPPHGGMAPGVDRIVMLLAQEQAIRDVIAFPMAQSVEDLLMGAPGAISEKQLREVHIKLDLPKPKP